MKWWASSRRGVVIESKIGIICKKPPQKTCFGFALFWPPQMTSGPHSNVTATNIFCLGVRQHNHECEHESIIQICFCFLQQTP